ncbi:MAG: cupin domain-containing protein [Haloferacaceae archaeon]
MSEGQSDESLEEIDSPRQQYDKPYREFQAREGLPVHEGWAVEDVRSVAVDDWERTGGRGAFVNLRGMEHACDVQVHEIPPGEALEPQRHLYEALVFVVSGSGFTTIGEGEDANTFEWSKDSLFYLPHNTRYVHTNAEGDEPARLLASTSAPLLYTLFRNDQAIWNVEDYDQWSVIGEEDYYSSVAQLKSADDTRTYWDANFVPDVAGFDNLAEWDARGVGNKSVFFPFRGSAMDSHISEFESGRYKKAHRHMSGANVMLLSGEGYSLMWREGEPEEKVRVDWEPYTLFTPPTMFYHQHFNTSEEPARYVVFHGPQQGTGLQRGAAISSDLPENQIEYHQEDPEVRETFQRELDAAGVENQMDEGIYERAEDAEDLFNAEGRGGTDD